VLSSKPTDEDGAVGDDVRIVDESLSEQRNPEIRISSGLLDRLKDEVANLKRQHRGRLNTPGTDSVVTTERIVHLYAYTFPTRSRYRRTEIAARWRLPRISAERHSLSITTILIRNYKNITSKY
jgi:hypothetical protein